MEEEFEPKRSWLWPIVALLVVLNVVAVLLLLPVITGLPDGGRMPDLVRFLGRFHPVLLHLPIGILALLTVIELGRMLGIGRRGGSTTFVAFAAALSAVLAAVLGFLLYHGGGWEESGLALRHMWGGLILASGASVTFTVKVWADAFDAQGVMRWLSMAMFRLLLFASCAVMVYTSHDGASLTHGENYLTKYMPPQLGEWLKSESPDKPAAKPLEEQLVYDDIIVPMLERTCTNCHDENKQKGKLRMDSHAALMAGGQEGPAIEPGSAEKSNIIVRIRLSEDDDEHMPPEGKPDLTDEEVKVLEWWLDVGAPVIAKVGELEVPDEIRDALGGLAQAAPAATEAEDESSAGGEVEDVRSGIAGRMAPLQEIFPGALDFESQESDGLTFSAVSMRDKFDDAALGKLAPVLGDLVALDLSSTTVSDAGVAGLSAAVRLRKLRLSETTVSDASMKTLAGLPELESLNLFGTAVSDEGIALLADAPKLASLYLWRSKVTDEGIAALREKLPQCRIELGSEQ